MRSAPTDYLSHVKFTVPGGYNEFTKFAESEEKAKANLIDLVKKAKSFHGAVITEKFTQLD